VPGQALLDLPNHVHQLPQLRHADRHVIAQVMMPPVLSLQIGQRDRQRTAPHRAARAPPRRQAVTDRPSGVADSRCAKAAAASPRSAMAVSSLMIPPAIG
jgi:hypothetical protein